MKRPKKPVFVKQVHVDFIREYQNAITPWKEGNLVNGLKIYYKMTKDEALQTVLYLTENPDVMTVEECTSCKGT